MEFLGGLISGIGDFIWSLFESAINGLLNGVKTIVGWVGSFFEFLGNLLKDLFVPAENFFDDEVGKLNDNLNSKIDVSEFESSFNSLKNVKARSIPVPRSSNVMGVNIQFDWISGINEHIGTIHMFIRAFVYLILLRFNVNNVYKLIRGSNLYGGGDD